MGTKHPWCRVGYWTVLVGAASLAGGRTATAQEPPSAFEVLAAAQDALAASIERCEKSVVAVARVRKNQQERFTPMREPFGPFLPLRDEPEPDDPEFVPDEFATGVVVQANGLILTSYHVLEDDCDYWITTSERKVYKARDRIWAADPRSDLAVLKIDAQGLAPMPLGDASTLKKGHIVIALGNPYAIARDGQPSASWGIVSNLTRKAAGNPHDAARGGKHKLHHYGTLIQTDAKLNLGTSGGALLNLKGEMVGLTVALAAITGHEQSAGYAVPVDETFRRILKQLILGREVEFGFLGVAPESLAGEEIRRGMQGVRIDRVEPGTPAQRFGILEQDIVTAVNGAPVYDADGLVLNIGRLPPGSTARLTVERDGRTMEMNIELAKYAVTGRQIFTPEPAWRGLRVDYATATQTRRPFRRRFNRAPTPEGVVVTDVEPDSPAFEAGLRRGMQITHVDGLRVSTPRDFREAVGDSDQEIKLRLANIPGGESPERTISPLAAEQPAGRVGGSPGPS